MPTYSDVFSARSIEAFSTTFTSSSGVSSFSSLITARSIKAFSETFTSPVSTIVFSGPRLTRLVTGSHDMILQYPPGVWRLNVNTVGGELESDAHVFASYTVRRDPSLTVPFRVTEAEWPEFRELVMESQLENFAWYPDSESAGILVALDMPISRLLTPQRDPVLPWIFLIELTIRKASGTTWNLPFFEPLSSVIPLPWRSIFIYGSSGTAQLECSLPVGVWSPTVSTEGVQRLTATGVAGRNRTGRRDILMVPIRFYEIEWPYVEALIIWGQTKAPFEWQPDADDAQVFDVILDSPQVGRGYAPTRDGAFPRMLTILLGLRRADGSSWDLQYFAREDV